MCPHTLIFAGFSEGFGGKEKSVHFGRALIFILLMLTEFVNGAGGGGGSYKRVCPIGHIVAQKAFLAGLIFRGSYFGGAHRREFCVSKCRLGLTIK